MRYILFVGYPYYPDGGGLDAKDHSDDVEDLISKAKALVEAEGSFLWWHVLDITDLTLVAACLSEFGQENARLPTGCQMFGYRVVDGSVEWVTEVKA